MSDPSVVGLDLSLTSTGYAVIPRRGDVVVDRIVTKPTAGADLAARYRRLESILSAVMAVVDSVPDLVVIEGPSHGQARQGGQHDRAGLWWMTVAAIMAAGVPVAEVPPATRARYATGRGNAPKDAVLAAVVRRYRDVEVTGNDQADALILAAMGARQRGRPIEESLPKNHLAAMGAVRWPMEVGAARAVA